MTKTGGKHRLRLLWLHFSQMFATYKSKASDRNPWTAAAVAPGYLLEHKDHGFSFIHACLVSPKKSYMLPDIPSARRSEAKSLLTTV